MPVKVIREQFGSTRLTVDFEKLWDEKRISFETFQKLTHPGRKKPHKKSWMESAEEFEYLLKTGQVKTNADIARLLNISRAWVTMIMKKKKENLSPS